MLQKDRRQTSASPHVPSNRLVKVPRPRHSRWVDAPLDFPTVRTAKHLLVLNHFQRVLQARVELGSW
jgi:hypothetical protein